MRDEGLLESAVYRAQASFAGQDLFPDLISKVAAMGHSLLSNHPFVDGNKRVAYEAMRLMLRMNGIDIIASPDNIYKFVMESAQGQLSVDKMAEWLGQYSGKLKK